MADTVLKKEDNNKNKAKPYFFVMMHMEEEKEKNYVKEFLPYFIIIVVVIVIKLFVVSPIRVNGPSMEDTLHDKDIMILDEISYRFQEIERFDIVVIWYEDEYNREHIIKRVIGLPGEVIEYKDGKLYINDEYVKEDFSHKETENFSKIKLGKDEYFVMGDNRVNSTDSRILGPIPKNKIRGKTSFTLLPFSRFGSK